ncbi:hypothetical protein DFQ05_1599 [Winogradskyella wandonensis]|uniref:Uncharacterized protein n=1 Tax=Winogradskyella wandonensis TaxID=1442586 RepID=A0A4R1KS15_9FLAO|nr:hypothetical protein [Winogradskyella wandonensis]TCK67818.1 hypothetical protein DFQ05_1599 [Winogradskyella wandonensis]
MSENSQQTNQEEIDLLGILKAIGKGFQKIFDFISSLFGSIFKLIVLIVAHFFKFWKLYAGSLVLGLILGFILDKNSEKVYEANMFIKTNYDSAYQVYENILNLNELASVDQDSIKLSEVLDIDVELASKIKGFSIEPETNENEKTKMFSNFLRELDSVTASTKSYKDFEMSLQGYQFETHKLIVESTDKDIYAHLNDKLSKVLSENVYLNSLLEVNQKNLEREKQSLVNQGEELDVLINKYLEIRVKESQKEPPVPNAGTNISLGSNKELNLLVNEAPLLKEKLELQNRIREVEATRVKEANIVSVLANFPETGYIKKEWYEKNKYRIPVALFFTTILVMILFSLKSYLERKEYI